MDKTLPHVTHGRPSPRTLEEAIRETRVLFMKDDELAFLSPIDKLMLRNQMSIMEVLRGMQVIQREPR